MEQLTGQIGILLTVLVVLIFIAALYVAVVYNKLIQYRIDADNSWKQIGVQLKRRYDLIPNLVETVKAYLKHENETLVKVIEARNKAVIAKTPGEVSKAEGLMIPLLKELSMVIEKYPELKANENIKQLFEEITSTENKISFSRSHYNDVVANYNFFKEKFPSNVVAGWFKFPAREYFEIEQADKSVRQVKL